MIHLDNLTLQEPNTENGKTWVVDDQTPTIQPDLTAADFGWLLCPDLDALVTVWVEYHWDMDIWRQDLKPHLLTCTRCEANRQAAAKYREWKRQQELEVLNV